MQKQISADEAKKIWEQNLKAVFLDVRTEAEVTRGKIENSIHIPLEKVAERTAVVISDKNTKIIACCLSGARSEAAVNILKNLGYTDVCNMTNGLLEWRAKNYPLTS